MAYSVDNIIPVNLYLTSAGLGYGDFSSALIIADQEDLSSGTIFAPNTHRDYTSISEVSEDFATDSDIYLIATRYFTQIPKPRTISVWMRDPDDGALLVTLNKTVDAIWRYHYFLKSSDTTTANAILLGDWSDSVEHPVWITVSDDEVTEGDSDSDIASLMAAKGNRHIFLGYKTPASIDIDPSQAYAMVQLAAAFNKFRPAGIDTAITGEYQVLPGIAGDDLKTSQYTALKAKNAVFFTEIELAGEIDSSRVINSKSMSAYDEFIDDVFNLDVLKNHLQVDGYNYIAGSGTKRSMTPRGYAGLLDALTTTCKRFYNNGVLGEGSYVDSQTGNTVTAEYGFVIQAAPSDVLDMTSAERKKRKYPDTKILVILARAGHIAEINVYVE